MTREEIIRAWKEFDSAARKRYWDAGCRVDASLNAPLALAAWVRRATLEEAARVVCVGCDSTDKLFNDGVAWMHRDESPGYEGPYYRCVASKIHDLIAALDKEAEGE